MENAPETRKRLRQFPTVEAAVLLGASESCLRQITNDGAEFTCGTVTGNNYRRTFSLKVVIAFNTGSNEDLVDFIWSKMPSLIKEFKRQQGRRK